MAAAFQRTLKFLLLCLTNERKLNRFLTNGRVMTDLKKKIYSSKLTLLSPLNNNNKTFDNF